MAEVLEKRVSKLEKAHMQFTREIRQIIDKLSNSTLKLHIEMRDFKDEMRDFKDEMRDYKETAGLRIEELQASHQKMNEQWGNLANKMGTLVEDLVFPNMLTIAVKYFDCPPEPEDMYMRRYRRNQITSKKREFDVITVYTGKVIINETKTSVTKEHIDAFLNVLSEINSYFPEFDGLEIIPVMASLYVKQNVVEYASQKNIYIMAMTGGYMSIINPNLNA